MGGKLQSARYFHQAAREVEFILSSFYVVKNTDVFTVLRAAPCRSRHGNVLQRAESEIKTKTKLSCFGVLISSVFIVVHMFRLIQSFY